MHERSSERLLSNARADHATAGVAVTDLTTGFVAVLLNALLSQCPGPFKAQAAALIVLPHIPSVPIISMPSHFLPPPTQLNSSAF